MGRAYQNRKESIAKTSDMKAKVYSKYGRELYVCAKNGGADPSANLALRGLIDRAKRDQVPGHVIEKALNKAKGGGGEDFSPTIYEGFGPGGCMVIVECLTDNPTRTFNDVRQCFTKAKSKIGTPGTVSHMFDHSAILVFPGTDDEKVLEALMDADVDVTDIELEDGMISLFVPHTEQHRARTALFDAFGEIEFSVDEIQFVPRGETALGSNDVQAFGKFVDLLNALDDVQNVYHDASF